MARSLRITAEIDQPVAWVPLSQDWEGAFPQDRPHLRQYAKRLSEQ
uniref:Uncharacterized protein n=1 Tax=Nonomuraea gerenzanensis TaxID=93944 RepID=A0A1M4E462_9ACTN|nr:hypothetical protein BN4615_P3084 [Nonomuraea gerenzanensis]